MPTYEYLCTSCGHEWELEQSIKEDPQKICQKCNQETARRQISRGVGFILKGGGWYADLYSSPSNKPKDAPKDAKETKTESSSETKSGADSTSKSSTSSSTPAPSTSSSATATT